MKKERCRKDNRSWTVAIEVCLSFNFAVAFDFNLFRVSAKENSICRQCPHEQAKYGN
jgi:hypothetical protein